MANKIEDVISLIKAVSESNIDSFEYREGDTCISIKGQPVESSKIVTTIKEVPVEEVVVRSEAAVTTNAAKEEAAPAPEGHVINSPLVGMFYAAPAAGEQPFVKIGSTVKKGQVLAIIEAMKMMNEIESDVDGVVTNIFVSNEKPVEYGQPLFEII